jgi:S1-C subfamily serine protease
MTMRHPFARALLASLLSCSLAWAQADGQSDTAKDSPQVNPQVTTQEVPRALPPEPLQRVLQSVVTVQSRSDAQASTSRTLGQRREGSGVVIGPDLVLTIGYLLLEAESVDLIDHQGRRIPGQVRAVDNLTGLGLIRTLIPLRLDAVPLGDSDTLPTPGKLWTLGQNETAPTALELVSRKVFAGSWEYLLEAPLMTLPAVNNWSGSGLFDAQGQLVGIGSLLVQDVYGDQVPLPGNLFVPVNLLKDPLPDLVRTGKRIGPATPWLGITSQRLPSGGLGVLRVSPGSPAAQAGIAVGDTLLALQGQTLQDLPDFYRRVRALGPAGSRLTLTVRSEGQSREVELLSTDRATALKRPSGI